ncbi:MAG: Ig-like domain repeat protein [Candidatus Diapherotrites archaeon]|nr:Ig-like domain repeat protein [Candidatus Diapherotrites archaeon]
MLNEKARTQLTLALLLLVVTGVSYSVYAPPGDNGNAQDNLKDTDLIFSTEELSSLELKQQALPYLNSLLNTAIEDDRAKLLEARDAVEASLNSNYWKRSGVLVVDNQVFELSQTAANRIKTLYNRESSDLNSEQLLLAISRIVQADQQAAEYTLFSLQEIFPQLTDENLIATIQPMLSSAENAYDQALHQLSIGNSPNAIVHFQESWDNSYRAVLLTDEFTIPEVIITEPLAGWYTRLASILVSGTLWDVQLETIPSVVVAVNDLNYVFPQSNGLFSGIISLTEGSNAIVVYGIDQYQNIGTAETQVTLDTIAPEIFVAGVENNSFNPVSVTPVIEFSDLHLNETRIELNNQIFISGTEVLEEKEYSLVVYANDLAGNEQTQTVNFVIDRTVPEIALINPYNGQFVHNTLNVQGTVSDTYLDYYIWKIDGVEVARNQSNYSWNTQNFEDGEHTVTLFAIDNAGNSSETTAAVTVDNTLPVIEVSGVSDNEFYNSNITPVILVTELNLEIQLFTLNDLEFVSGTEVSAENEYDLNVTVIDKAGNRADQIVSFTIDKTAPFAQIVNPLENSFVHEIVSIQTFASDLYLDTQTLFLDGTEVSSNNSFEWNTLDYSDGEHSIDWVVIDQAGNSTTSSVLVTVDNTLPVVLVSGIQENVFYNSDRVPLVEVQDVNPDQLNVFLNTQPFELSNSISSDNEYSFTAIAVDRAGNIGQTTVNFVLDKTVPVVEIVSPVENSFLRQTVGIEGLTEDKYLSTVELLVDGTLVSNNSFFEWNTLNYSEGLHSIELIALDLAGNQSSQTIQVTVDNVLPELLVQNLTENGLYLNSDFTPKFELTETNPSVTSSLLNDLEYNLETVSVDGDYVLEITHTDLAGNSNSLTRTFVMDQTYPVTSIDSPTSGSFVRGIVLVQAQASDLHLSLTQLLIDNVLVSSENEFEWNTLNYAEGAHKVEWIALDLAGNQTNSVSYIVVDNTVPVIAIVGVTEGTFYNSNQTPLVVVHETNPKLTQAFLNNELFELDSTIVEEGEYTLEVQTEDLAGNTAVQSVSFVIDKTAPVTSIDSPSSGSFVSGNVSITASASDLYSLTHTLSIDGQVLTENNFMTWNTLNYSDGFHAIEWHVQDLAGNETNLTYAVTVDNTVPVIEFLNLEEGTYYNQFLVPEVKITETNLDSVQYFLNNQSYIPGTVIQENKEYVLEVQALDLAGNQSIESVSFIVDTLAPVVELSVPSASSFVRGVVEISGSVSDLYLDSTNLLIDNSWVTSDLPFNWNTLDYSDGNHVVTFTGTDLAGNSTTVSEIFTVDNTVPVFVYVLPNQPYTRWDVLVDFVLTEINKGVTEAFLNNESFDWRSVISAEGDYNLVLRHTDKAGNIAEVLRTFTIDKTKPWAEILSPENNSFVKGIVRVSADANDLHGIVYRLDVDQRVLTTGKSIDWNTFVEGDGLHVLKWFVIDVAANDILVEHTVTVDNTLPEIRFTNIQNGIHYNSSIIPEIEIVELNLQSVHYFLNNQPYVLGTPISQDNDYVLEIQVTDNAGNYVTRFINFVIDTTAPETVLTVPNTNDFVKGMVSVTGETSDLYLDTTTLYIDSLPVAYSFPFEWNTVNYSDGTHTVSYTAVDLAGNSTTVSTTVNVDNTLPAVTYVTPIVNSYVRQTVEINATIVETNLELLELLIDTELISNSLPFELNTLNYSDGEHQLSVTLTDQAGNYYRTDWTVFVDNTVPESTVSELIENPTLVEPFYSLTGTILDSSSIEYVLVNDQMVSVLDGDFSFDFNVIEGRNTITVTAVDLAGNQVVFLKERLVDKDLLPDFYELSVLQSDPLNSDSDFGTTEADESNNEILDDAEDLDQDGLPTFAEYFYGSNPFSDNSDADSLDDFFELTMSGTDPGIADSDEDGVLDSDEDFDGDSLTNAQEEQLHANPYLLDTDSDGLDDSVESSLGTNPIEVDSDHDGLLDESEIYLESNPLVSDSDNDGVLDSLEYYSQTFSDLNGILQVTIEGQGDLRYTTQVVETPEPHAALLELPDIVTGYYDISTDSNFLSAVVRLHYAESDLNGLLESEIRLFYYDEDLNILVEESVQGVNESENYVWAQTTHFSYRAAGSSKNWKSPTSYPWNRDPIVYSSGETLRLKARVYNIGIAPASNVPVSFYSGDPSSGGVLLGTVTVNNIPSGGNAEAILTWVASLDVDFLYVVVDAGNVIAEESETDNKAFRQFITEFNGDSDGDGLSDYEEINGMRTQFSNLFIKTDPYEEDTDGDGLTDNVEMNLGGGTNANQQYLTKSNPSKLDSDNDGLTDYEELAGRQLRITNNHSDAVALLSDLEFGNSLSDNVDTGTVYSDAYMVDTDADGLTDYREFEWGSNPRWVDSDSDGLKDGVDDDPSMYDVTPPSVQIVSVYQDEWFGYKIKYVVTATDSSGIIAHWIIHDGIQVDFATYANRKNPVTISGTLDVSWLSESFTGTVANVKVEDYSGNQLIKDLYSQDGVVTSAAVAAVKEINRLYSQVDPFSGGIQSGIAISLIHQGEDIVGIVKNPGSILDGIRGLGTAVDEQGIGVVSTLYNSFKQRIDESHNSLNPFKSSDWRYSSYQGGFYTGYVGGLIITSVVGAGVVSKGLSVIKAGSLVSKISKISIVKSALSIVKQTPRMKLLLGAAGTVAATYWLKEQFPDIDALQTLSDYQIGFATMALTAEAGPALGRIAGVTAAQQKRLVVFLSRNSKFTVENRVAFLKPASIDNGVAKIFSDLSDDLQDNIFIASHGQGIPSLERSVIVSRTNRLKNVPGVDDVVRNLNKRNWHGHYFELDAADTLRTRGHNLIELSKKYPFGDGELDVYFQHLNGKKIVAEIKSIPADKWLTNKGNLDPRIDRQLDRYARLVQTGDAQEAWVISENTISPAARTLIENKGIIIKYIGEI